MSKRKPLTTTFNLLLVNGLTICLSFFVFIVICLFSIRRTANIQTKQNLRTFAYSIERFIQLDPNLCIKKEPIRPHKLQENQENIPVTMDDFVKQFASHTSNFRITIIAADGTVIGESDSDLNTMENHLDREEVIAALNGREFSCIRKTTISDEKFIYFAMPFSFQDEKLVLRLSMPEEKNAFFSSSIGLNSIFFALILLFIVIFYSLVIANKILKPLDELEKASKEYQNGNLDYIPNISSPKEFAELAKTFSDMSLTIKNNIEKISRRRDELQTVFSVITEALLVIDNNLAILRMNNKAMIFFNITEDSLANEKKSIVDIINNPEIIEYIKDTINTPELNDTELEAKLEPYENSSEATKSRNVLVRCVKIENTGNENAQYLIVITDISKLKRLETVRKDFVANVSHELKTPITSIKGFIETLQDGAIDEPETARHFLAIMEQQSKRLSSIIEDLLILSRLEQMDIAMELVVVNLQTLISDVVYSQSYLAEKKEITIKQIYLPQDFPININVNPGLFSQAISNLLDNAIKYSPEKSKITITSCIKNVKKGKESYLQISVQDNGPGIPENCFNRIFERFYRFDNGRSREAGGTGLGLSIVKHIIELHNGTIVAKKRPDGENGGYFEIILPLSPTNEKPISKV